MGIKSMVNPQTWKSLPQIDHSSFGHPSAREIQFREAGQPFQMRQSGIGHLGAAR